MTQIRLRTILVSLTNNKIFPLHVVPCQHMCGVDTTCPINGNTIPVSDRPVINSEKRGAITAITSVEI